MRPPTFRDPEVDSVDPTEVPTWTRPQSHEPTPNLVEAAQSDLPIVFAALPPFDVSVYLHHKSLRQYWWAVAQTTLLFQWWRDNGHAHPPASAPSPAVYISYAWGDDSETGSSREDIVNRLYESLRAGNYDVRRDKMDLGYKGLISQFMAEIGGGDCIVVVISDKFLRSPYCMWELLQIYRAHQFRERVFPILLADATIRSLADRLEYCKFWKSQFRQLTKSVKQVGIEVLSAEGSLKEYEKYREITHSADRLVSILADINSQTPGLIEANDFAALKRAIDQRLLGKSRRP